MKILTSNHMKSLIRLGYISSILFIILGLDSTLACGPGRAGGRRIHNRLRKYPPLVQRQYIPNVSENTLGASGRPEGPIRRTDSKRFKELVQNWNPDIEFRDDERTGADRMMSQRLKEKLSVLAISVMNQWPNVRLRVIEGWDEDMRHSVNSLHYEGRAVDITTSDKDKSKYGMLARLAVEAGFDWVHYESRSHVHCSVKSEKADTIRNNGCFDAKSLVETPLGQIEMSQLQTNDLVLAMNSQTGQLQFSPIMMWLDRDETGSELYVELTTKSGQLIRLTSSHLIYMADELPSNVQQASANQTGTLDGLDLSRQASEGNGNNNYYYYDYNTLNNRRSDDRPITTTTTTTTATSTIATETKLDRQIVATSPEATSESNKLEGIKQDVDLREFVYTDYARNVLIGQYVLISSLNEPLVELGTQQPQQHKFGIDLQQSTNRLVFEKTEHERGKYKKYKNRREQYLRLTNSNKIKVKFDQIVSVNYVNRAGIYAPLTREGNIVVNSVVASCYAVINDHDLAHWSFTPVRWLNILKEYTVGLRPETPLIERLPESLQRRQAPDSTNLNRNTTNGLDRPSAHERHIHWYPILLYNIARIILPNKYLY